MAPPPLVAALLVKTQLRRISTPSFVTAPPPRRPSPSAKVKPDTSAWTLASTARMEFVCWPLMAKLVAPGPIIVRSAASTGRLVANRMTPVVANSIVSASGLAMPLACVIASRKLPAPASLLFTTVKTAAGPVETPPRLPNTIKTPTQQARRSGLEKNGFIITSKLAADVDLASLRRHPPLRRKVWN